MKQEALSHRKNLGRKVPFHMLSLRTESQFVVYDYSNLIRKENMSISLSLMRGLSPAC